MTNTIKDLLLIQSFNLDGLIEDYRLFFLGILPSIFVLAVLFEYFDRMNVFALVKRAFVAVLILTTVASFYKVSIDYSIDAANEKLESQKGGNILLMDMFDAIDHWDKLSGDKKGHNFYKDRNVIWGTLAFLKFHMFDKFVNDGFTLSVFFLSQLCFLILKVVYSLVYYLGYGLIGIPIIIYMFPTMGNVLRGGILSYLWCLVVPHVLVFILSMISTEINKGYIAGQIIGGSATGTALLFILTLFVAFTPLITAMILNGSGISQAGGIIATIGANYVMNLPKNTANTMATVMTGGALGPKMKLAQSATKTGFKMAKGASLKMSGGIKGENRQNGKSFNESNMESASKSNRSFKQGQENTMSSKVTTQHISEHMQKILKSLDDKSIKGVNQTRLNTNRTDQIQNSTNTRTKMPTFRIEERSSREEVSKSIRRNNRPQKTR